MLVRTGSVKEIFLLGLQSQHIVLKRTLAKRTEQHREVFSQQQLPAAAYLEAYKDVSHLLLGQSVSKTLQAGSHSCLPTQLACR